MVLSQRMTDVVVMFLSASGGAIVGVAADAWWWVPVGLAGLAVAGLLLFVSSLQKDRVGEVTGTVNDHYDDQRLRRLIREELRSALGGPANEPPPPPPLEER